MNQEQFNLKLDELSKMLKTMDDESEQNLNLEMGEIEGDFEKIFDGKITIKYKSNNKKELKYNYQSDSGFDLYSNEEIIIPPFGRALVPTGVYFDLPQDFEIQVRSKSGLAINQGLMVLNSPGTVDEGYTGEIKVIVFNTNQSEFKIENGMKVAQAVVSRCVTGRWVNLVQVDKIEDKDRGNKGFGSTGI
jgi:dUTP pyrophosphatase